VDLLWEPKREVDVRCKFFFFFFFGEKDISLFKDCFNVNKINEKNLFSGMSLKEVKIPSKNLSKLSR
jgi:hypothetical protein